MAARLMRSPTLAWRKMASLAAFGRSLCPTSPLFPAPACGNLGSLLRPVRQLGSGEAAGEAVLQVDNRCSDQVRFYLWVPMAKCAKVVPLQSPMHSQREDVDVAGDEDLDFCECREPGVLLWRGFTLQEFANQCFGNKLDYGKGRQMPIHYGSSRLNYFTVSSPIA
ncbi:hypothetical protein B296_00025244 [Ensete ventricosum]|uniref:Dehydrogenase E1 component domain-containing protein n=1 Tax=Ensete ventricosum TaxID=4639 RepID=A0A426Z4Z5_ENSVE|nr:hypothetical protein B296_00025244 [Ensete ventricosum]